MRFHNPILREFYETSATYHRNRRGLPRANYYYCRGARVQAYKQLIARHGGERVERHAKRIVTILNAAEMAARETVEGDCGEKEETRAERR